MIPLRDDNPTEITPVVTVAFIVMCVLVFLYEISLPPSTNEAFVYMYGAIPAVVFGHVQLPPELMSLPAYGTLILQYVFARRMDASYWEYAVLVDLWK